jgi:hypothetical protein
MVAKNILYSISCGLLVLVYVLTQNIATVAAITGDQARIFRENIPFYDIDQCGTAQSAQQASTTGITPGPIYIMGDSITALAKDTYINKFKGSGWDPTVEGLSSRQIVTTPPSPSGLGQLDKDKDLIGKTNAIVIALGTNGSGNSEASIKNDVSDAMKKLKQYNTSSAPIYWVNILDTRNDSDSTKTNRAISSAVGNDGTVIDWYTTAKSSANLSSFNEGVHPTAQKDIDLLVNLVYNSVSKGSGNTATAGGSATGSDGTYTYISAGNIPVSGSTVQASTFGGSFIDGKWGSSNDVQGVDPPRTSDDNGKGNSPDGIAGKAGYAELSVAVGSGDYSALGGLPEHTKLQITYNGKSVIAEKLDVGAGGDSHPLIDLWWETAKLLNFTGGNGKVTLHAVPNSTPTTPVGGQATDTNNNVQPGCCPDGSGGGSGVAVSGSVSPNVGKGTSSKGQENLQKAVVAAGEKFDVDPNFIAAFYYAENSRTGDSTNNADSASGTPATGDGKWREPAPDYGTGPPWPGINAFSAYGPWQFITSTWQAYKPPGSNDTTDRNDLYKSALAAGKYLAALGAKKGADESKLRQAAFGYNHSDTYASSVVNTYKYLSGAGSVNVSSDGSASGCSSGTSSIEGYKDPYRDVKQKIPMRIDMGLDYGGVGPIYAIGNGTVNVVHKRNGGSGWPGWGVDGGGGWVSYTLSDGPAKGKTVYFAENCQPVVNEGDQVTPDTKICDLDGLTSAWSESGWAADKTTTWAAAHVEWSGHDSSSYYTAYGENFSQLIHKLGEKPGTKIAGAQKIGTLPSGWPTWE